MTHRVSLVPALGQIMTILRFASFFPLEYLVRVSEPHRDILSCFKLMKPKKTQILQLLVRTQIYDIGALVLHLSLS